MQLQIESTDEITTMENVPVRVWRAVTESGVPCIVFVHRLAEQLPPASFVPLRNIL